MVRIFLEDCKAGSGSKAVIWISRKDGIFFTRADATLDLIALGEKQEFWVEVVPNWKREWIMTVFKMKVFPKYVK